MTKKEIQDLYQSLIHAEEGIEKCKDLLSKRNQLEEAIITTEWDESKEDLLKKMKLKLRELDALIDDLEELNDETIAGIKNTLIEAILADKPETDMHYRHIFSQNQQLIQEEGAINQKILVYDKLLESLDKVFEARQAVRKRGLLDYIFGVSPNYTITQHLKAIQTIIEHQQDPTLKELGDFCKEKWGFKSIDIKLKELHSHLLTETNILKQKHAHLKTQISTNEGQLKSWLYQSVQD